MANPDLWTPSGTVAKAATASVMPAAIATALDAQGMNSSTQFGPGRPMNPAWGYSTRPRAMDYPVGVNITAGNNRAQWGRTSFDTLKGIIEAYDIARACIDHKISELQSMEPLLSPLDGVSGDVDDAITAARAALEFPDRDLPYLSWLSKWLEGCYRYDAGMLYRRRNRAGDIIGLDVIDGTTVAPKVDQHGRKPRPPAVAFQQVIKGLPTVDFTTDDLIPTIFRPQADSPFGLAPIESVLLTANTDLRFQKHFLELFTDGTVPHGLVELPGDISTPDQVAEWQDYWDALMLGDQAMLRRLRAVPMGTKLTETRPARFDTAFAEYLASRTASAFGVLPQDLGLNHDINRANGETQTDIQFRVNTLPWVRFVEGVLSRYLRYDLGLPVQVKLNTGRDKEDRKTEAEAWQIYVNTGAASVDEMREELLGLPTDNERPVPRFVMDPRVGPIPLASIEAIAGRIDPETAAPADGVPLGTEPYAGAGGVMAYKPPGGAQFARAPINPDEPRFPELEHPVPGSETAGVVVRPAPVVKEATAGVTSGTGIAGSPLAGVTPNEEDDEELVDLTPTDVAKAAELAAFRRFTKARAKAGRWRDFQFVATDEATAHALNQHARARLRKTAGQVVAAGLAVVAADTGRVLMLQRALDPTDPNGGLWECPGGCLDDGEEPSTAALREWAEETGLTLPAGTWAGSWTSPNGVYTGYVYRIGEESALPIFDRAEGWNPDDPDGDLTEALAWWDPATLGGNPVIRPELGLSWEQVLDLLEDAGKACPCGMPITFDEGNGWQHADGSISHDGEFYGQSVSDLVTEDGSPKAPDPVTKSWRDGDPDTPQQEIDLRLTDYWAPRIADALTSMLTGEQLRAAIDAGKTAAPPQIAKSVNDDGGDDPKQRLRDQVVNRLAAAADTSAVDTVIRQTIADSYRSGTLAASQQLGVAGDLWAGWQPGDLDAAIHTADGGLKELLDSAGVGIKNIVGTALDQLGNRIADGLLDGASVDTIAASLADWVTGDRAELIAHTETARAVDAATMGVYTANGIHQFDVITSGGACPVCLNLAAANPHPVAEGGIVPAHPRCRCSSSPVVPY